MIVKVMSMRRRRRRSRVDRFKKTESDEVALRWWIVADHLFIT